MLVFVCSSRMCTSVLTYADPDACHLSLEMLVSSVVVLALDCSFGWVSCWHSQQCFNGFAQGRCLVCHVSLELCKASMGFEAHSIVNYLCTRTGLVKEICGIS